MGSPSAGHRTDLGAKIAAEEPIQKPASGVGHGTRTTVLRIPAQSSPIQSPPSPVGRLARLSRSLLPPTLAGGALGAWEGALVLASYSHNLGWSERIYIFLIPCAVYGTLFWSAGVALELLFGRWLATAERRRRLLNTAWVLGTAALALWVLRHRLYTGLSRHLLLAVPPAAFALACAFCGWWCYRTGRLRWVSFALPGFTFLGIAAFLLLTPHKGGGDLPGRAPSGPAPEGKPNVVFITWDTVRADTLPIFGGGGLETPELDRLAAEGFVFDDFQAVAPVTGPAHASIFTGLFPPSHGLRSNGQALPDEPNLTLAEHFEAAGYATGGFVSGLPVTATFGFDAGFQAFDGRVYEDSLERIFRVVVFSCSLVARVIPKDLHPPTSATDGEVTLGRAQRWLAGAQRPFFVWMHLYDAHSPYRPPEPYRTQVLERGEEGPQPVDPSRQQSWVLQRGEIERIDGLAGGLLDAVRERDPGLENTAVVLVADHGECFGEGGFNGHHASIYQATQRVVGLVRPPGSMDGVQRGGRSAVTASQVDLFPTLCEIAGLEQPPVHGLSLMPLLRGEAGFPERGLYLEAYTSQLRDGRIRAWRARPWTYGVDLTGEEILIHDELGVVEVADADPALLERLRDAQRSFLRGIRILESEEIDDPDVAKGLEDLGYVSIEEGA